MKPEPSCISALFQATQIDNLPRKKSCPFALPAYTCSLTGSPERHGGKDRPAKNRQRLHMNNPFMARAIQLSIDGVRSGLGGPFGAVIVKGGKIVAESENRVTSTNDPTAHAEVLA